jgi:hypothetical protein
VGTEEKLLRGILRYSLNDHILKGSEKEYTRFSILVRIRNIEFNWRRQLERKEKQIHPKVPIHRHSIGMRELENSCKGWN